MSRNASKAAPKGAAKNISGKQYVSRLSILLILLVIVIGFLGYFRVFMIKMDRAKLEATAINQQINKIQDKVVAPNRGDIVDRNGETLAVGETVFDIILDPLLLVDVDKAEKDKAAKARAAAAANGKDYTEPAYSKDTGFAQIESILGISKDTLESYVALDAEGKPAKNNHYLKIAQDVSYENGKKINDLGYNWLYGEQDTKRSYPHGSLAAQVLGFTRGDTSWGLERYYNNYMLGIPGRTFRTYESDGSIVTQRENPIKGNKVVTTLDAHLQQYADEACKEAYNAYEPEYTSSIIMNPSTGEVLAMSQYPSFDPNNPMKLSTITDEAEQKAFDALTDEEKYSEANKAWKNFNISETFEPGSIYKPVVVAMALEEGIISPNDTFVCGGYKKVADAEIKCHLTSGHGTLDVAGVLAQSCNVGMMDIIAKMSPETYLKYQHDFGFGEKTGIDLPGESSAANLLNTLDSLHSVEMATNSFGQGFNCTALQAANAMAAIINGGKLMQPYVVSQILDNDGNIIDEKEPQIVRQVISKNTSDWIRQALGTTYTEGTAKKAQITGYSFGGKTGTAQQSPRSEQKYVLSFIAYHSVENPDIMVMTVIHKPSGYNDSGGEATPVPMLKEIFEKIIDYEAIPPDFDEGSEKTGSADTSYTVKDYTNTNLKDTVNQLISEGIDFQILGSGDTVISQSPAGGTNLDEKPSKILLTISAKGKTKLIPIPTVVGLSVSDAKQMLESAGFNVDVTEENDGDYGYEQLNEPETEAVTSKSDTTENTSEKSVQENEGSSSNSSSSGPTVYVQMPEANVRVESGMTIKIRAR
ncbi:MAG: penicillin-binding transpeptidase domain-containing protein [Clostridia bacterium]|nr:penicillin-binding transpeptidase domain-containing protein [Clostridia bacterium]